MNQTSKLLVLLSAVLVCSASLAEDTGRPDSLKLSNFQFGPENRWAFSHLREVLPTANIAHDNRRVLPLERDPAAVNDLSIPYQGREQTFDAIAKSMFIDGVLVLKGDRIVFEKYYGQLTETQPHLMNSVSKSVVALVAARLAADGVIDLEKPVSHYVPALAGSGWGPDSLRTLLDMRDGAAYTEDYPDFSTSFRLQDCAIGWTDADYCPEDGPRGGYAFFPTIGRDEANLGHFHYKSGSTSVIGWVLEAASGRRLADLVSETIWKPMGAEFDAYITVDASSFALADHGMNSALRDLGRVGLLVLNKGRALGQQVVPADFIEDLYAQPGDPAWPYPAPAGTKPYYRSFWWGVGNAERDLIAYGIHGQTIRVAPAAGMVVAMYSTWPLADGDNDRQFWEPMDEITAALVEKFR